MKEPKTEMKIEVFKQKDCAWGANWQGFVGVGDTPQDAVSRLMAFPEVLAETQRLGGA